MNDELESVLASLAEPGHEAGFVRLVKDGCEHRFVEFAGTNVYHTVQDLLALGLVTKSIENKYIVTHLGFERIRQSEYLNRKV